MPTMTAAKAQSQFGELLDLAQGEPVAITRDGRTVAYVVSEYDYRAVQAMTQDRAKAFRWYDDYVTSLKNDRSPETPRIADQDIKQLINEYRA